MESYKSYKQILKIIEKKITENPRTIIAIDGRCGSGKTTFANLLKEKYHVDIVHVDDFFLPLNLRTEKRLSECGGNMHYERLKTEVIENLHGNKPFEYHKFDCSKMDFFGTVSINPAHAVVVEGAYCMREEFDDCYDFKIFFDIEKQEQKQRIINRNGMEMYKNFENMWIPKEEAYFEKMHVKRRCDVVVCN